MDNSPENGTVTEAVNVSEMSDDAIGALLMGKDLPKADTPEQQNEETDLSAPETEELEATEQSEAEGETVDEEPEIDPEIEQPESVDFAPSASKVKLSDGTETTVQELMDGYFRQSDYSRKSDVNAKKADELRGYEEQLIQHATASRQSHLAAKTFLEQNAPPIPNPALVNSDPAEYQRQDVARRAFETQWHANQQALQGDEARISMVNEQEEARSSEKFEDDLLVLMPQLKQPEAMKTFATEVTKVASDYGFSQQDLMSFKDPQVFKMLDRLNTLEKQEASRSRGRAKAKAQPPKPGVIKGSSQRANGNSVSGANFSKKLARAKKSGKSGDLVDTFAEALFGK